MRRLIGFVALVLLVSIGPAGGTVVRAADPAAGTWTAGGAIGFLGNAPDNTAFALNLHVDRFLNQHVSVGPLLQMAFTGDMTQTGLSGQGKYWLDLPGTSNRLKLVMQAGIGFVHSDFRNSDTSWLIPLGVGLDYKVDETVTLTSTFLLNFTDLDTGRGTGSSVMPGLTFGVRF
ncbi:hypothetical protein [Nitrospira sp. Kam-Ns4a]